jgi:hypothetical protein
MEEAMEQKKIPRSTFHGDLYKLTEDIANLQKKKGKKGFLVYEDENKTAAKSKLIRGAKGIDANLEFLKIAHDHQKNLSFNKSTVKAVMQKVAITNKLKFTDEKEKDNWIEVMICRWRNICKHVSAAEVRQVKPKWLSILPWIKGESNDEEQAEEEEQSDPDEVEDPVSEKEIEQSEPAQKARSDPVADGDSSIADEVEAEEPAKKGEKEKQKKEEPAKTYQTRFSTELMLPLRNEENDGPPRWEVGAILNDRDPSVRDEEKIRAGWPDGFEESLQETIGYLRGLTRTSGHQKMDEHWSMEHVKTANHISIQQRTDRALLMVIYEQGKQICSVRVDKFGEVPNQERLPPDSEVVERAVEFLRPLAEKYAKDEITDKELLKQEKDKQLQTIPTRAPGPYKVLAKRKAEKPEEIPPKPETTKEQTTAQKAKKKKPAKEKKEMKVEVEGARSSTSTATYDRDAPDSGSRPALTMDMLVDGPPILDSLMTLEQELNKASVRSESDQEEE